MTQISVYGQRHVLAPLRARWLRLFADAAEHLGVQPVDLEIGLLETPRHDWGIRGLPGDELALAYEVQR